jgi:hypothetical protein
MKNGTEDSVVLDSFFTGSRLVAAFHEDEVVLRLDATEYSNSTSEVPRIIYKAIPLQAFIETITSNQIDTGLIPCTIINGDYIIVRRICVSGTRQIVLTEASPRIWNIKYAELRGVHATKEDLIDFKLYLPHLLMCTMSHLGSGGGNSKWSVGRSTIYAMEKSLTSLDDTLQGLILPNVNPDYRDPAVCWGTTNPPGDISSACTLIPLFFSSIFNHDYMGNHARPWLEDWEKWTKEKKFQVEGFKFFDFINGQANNLQDHRMEGRNPVSLAEVLSSMVHN